MPSPVKSFWDHLDEELATSISYSVRHAHHAFSSQYDEKAKRTVQLMVDLDQTLAELPEREREAVLLAMVETTNMLILSLDIKAKRLLLSHLNHQVAAAAA
jgi:TRAP-type mannitol/chloroaromatic compound transport system substrate-binding protein